MESSSSSSSPSPPPLDGLSIYQIARLHCRERLIVDPVYWTGRHVELLGFSFEEPTVAPKNKLSPLPYEGPPGRNGSGFVKKFLSRDKYDAWDQDMWYILDYPPETPFTSLPDIHFCYGPRFSRKLESILFFPKCDPLDAERGRLSPVFAHADRKCAHSLRFDRVYASEARRSSKPINCLRYYKLKKLTPPEPLHDPYIVALLIAVAQRQLFAMRLSGQEEQAATSIFLSQVLWTDLDDKDNIHLFAADISFSLLEKLDFPTLPPSEPAPPISIRHTVIPYRPLQTFRRRLIPLLLRTIDDHGPNKEDEGIEPQSGEQQGTKE